MVFGGPMDVWQEDLHPWLAAEKAGIRRWVKEKQAPFLGVCLGHQLLADALGGSVGLMAQPEVGVFDIKLTAAGRAAALFDGMPAGVSGAAMARRRGLESFRPTPWRWRKTSTARSRRCKWARKHSEFSATSSQDEHTVAEWGSIAAYRRALEKIMGPGGQQRLERAAQENREACGAAAQIIYRNFRRLMES